MLIPCRMKLAEDTQSSREEDLLVIANLIINKLDVMSDKINPKKEIKYIVLKEQPSYVELLKAIGLSPDIQCNFDYLNSLLEEVPQTIQRVWAEVYHNLWKKACQDHLKRKS